jgi:beta-lactamase regulating signal transducer with metallopeptidase domain
METLSWMQDGELIALGWTLLHFCWQGALIAVLYAAADRLTMGAGVRVRYAVALLALMLMPIAATVTFVEQARLVVHVPRGGREVVASQLGVLHAGLVKSMPITAPMVESGELWIAGNARHLLPWIDGVWLAGVLLLALRAAGGWYEMQRIRGRAALAIPAEVAVSFARVQDRLRMGRRVVLRVSDEVISPMAMGVWRAAVILPVSALMQLEPAQLEAVLAHELAHIRRWDYLYNLLQTIVECLLFFHPAVWWVSRCTRDLREACCDEVAARSCEDPVIYAEALLQLEEQRTRHVQLAMAAKGREGTLLIRVRQILGEGMTMERTTTSGVRVAVAGAIVLGLLLGSRGANGLNLAHRMKPVMSAARADVAAVMPRGHKSVTAAMPRPVSAQVVEPVADPIVTPVVNVVATPNPVVTAVVTPMPIPMFQGGTRGDRIGTSGQDYIREMKDAGYPLDLDKDLDTLISLRSVGVTPEFAKAMAQAGLGTPTLHDLISLKAVGVTPEYLTGLRGSGLAPTDFHEVISERSVGVTPEYAKEIASLGIGAADVHELIGLRAQGVTPAYAAELKGAGIPVTDLHELMSMKAVGVTPEYAKSMAAVGFTGMNSHELISMRALGVTPEYVQWVKQTFPDADMRKVREGASMHVDADFVAKAKAHGFTSADFDKLVKLKMTGLID